MSKIQIRFKNSDSIIWPCLALADFNGQVVAEIGKTWQEVEEAITAKLKAMSDAGPVPEPIEVQI